MNRKLIALTTLLLIFVFILSACGSVNGSGVPTNSSTQSTSNHGVNGSISMGQQPTDTTSSSNQPSLNSPEGVAQALCNALVNKDYATATGLYALNNGAPNVRIDITNCQITGSSPISSNSAMQMATVYTTWTMTDGSTYQGTIFTENYPGDSFNKDGHTLNDTGIWRISDISF